MSEAFRYVDEPHGYFLGEEELPSPSKVFNDLGLVNPKWFTEDSRSRGRAVHAWIAEALAGRSYAAADPEIKPYVDSGLRLVEHLKPKIIRLETPLYHPKLLFAGTFDAEWEVNDAWRWIVDWKSGKAPKVARYQTAAYEMLAKQGTPKFFKRAAVELQADGSMAHIQRYDDPSDLGRWLQLLGAWRIRQELRSRPLDEIMS